MNHSYELPVDEVSYNFAFLDEFAKREIRRSILKAISIPGYQTPYASREMPMGRGFGTGGLQLTLSLLGAGDTLKVIDQGADDSVNAVNLRQFVELTCPGTSTTERAAEANIIQSRHRIPEDRLTANQILVLQVPTPDPLAIVEPSEARRKIMHGESDYASLLTKLYEDIVQFDEIAISNRYPTRLNGHYVIDSSPIPRFDVPKMHQSAALILLGAGRERKVYAVPPFTDAVPLAFEDVAFRTEAFLDHQGTRRHCDRCDSSTSYLDEIMHPDGSHHWQCSDTGYCNDRCARRDSAGSGAVRS
ncbi:alpha-D-ribose 1-methylphosphonate 5-phosphate C-P-lyase PhnJ [Marinobacter confluentis]|uniref:Alpha-D-ribose 1-methylphosphonate 5-phosphate C-P lyase n=1 Tax=Marinobacter confluentis TaxID=1697557 RepID=A0A4Z1C7Z4_9GAMM|nr:alpha-D-ribose 1-methylphosphonate 5-phosphate C-P-lyase PhnJ [Marinobacter confluentis]TGN39505.1 carbon-phosphorus lyase complex subunit PhnJ [Marinobacter confluentis]